MSKFRQIYTSFWSNAYIQEEMTAEDKYFYLYLLTNEQTKQIGVYQITKKQMAFDLGYSIESVNALVKRFEEHHKLIKYDAENREIVIIKWGGLNLNRGGKPVEDLIKKELLEVKNIGFLNTMLVDCPDNSLKKIIEDFIKAGEAEFMPSKDIRKRYIRLREKNQCFYTGKELEEYFDVSRIRVKSEGGGDQIYNLVACSKNFNIDKTNLGLKAACIKNNIDITELKKKIEELKIFEEEREINKISYREAIEKNIFEINTIRKYKNTNRKNEDKNITENDEVNEINNFYDTSAINNKEEIINNKEEIINNKEERRSNKEKIQENLYRLNDNPMEQDLIYKEFLEQSISEEVGMLIIDFLEVRNDGKKTKKQEVRELLSQLKYRYSGDKERIKALKHAIASGHKSLVYEEKAGKQDSSFLDGIKIIN